jgi:Tat protein translocase TatB subunit
MFGIGTPEVIGIVLITLLVYGPDRLPQMIKKVVGFLRQIKNVTDEVSNTVSKEIHRIEQSTEIKEARHLIEQNRNLLNESKTEIHTALNKPVSQPMQDTSNDQPIINDSNNDNEPSK